MGVDGDVSVCNTGSDDGSVTGDDCSVAGDGWTTDCYNAKDKFVNF